MHSSGDVRRKHQCRVIGRLLRSVGDNLNEEYSQRQPRCQLQQVFIIAVNILTRILHELYR